MGVYTKRGDKGKTSLIGKKKQEIRVSKNSETIETIGTIDELNAFLGIITSTSKRKNLVKKVRRVQRNLFTIGSIFAGADEFLEERETKGLEKEIDLLEEKLPVVKNFTLPGGSVIGAHLHFARAISRRAERMVVSLSRKKKVSPKILRYINRLSDYFYILARDENKTSKKKEIIWKGKNSS